MPGVKQNMRRHHSVDRAIENTVSWWFTGKKIHCFLVTAYKMMEEHKLIFLYVLKLGKSPSLHAQIHGY